MLNFRSKRLIFYFKYRLFNFNFLTNITSVTVDTITSKQEMKRYLKNELDLWILKKQLIYEM